MPLSERPLCTCRSQFQTVPPHKNSPRRSVQQGIYEENEPRDADEPPEEDPESQALRWKDLVDTGAVEMIDVAEEDTCMIAMGPQGAPLPASTGLQWFVKQRGLASLIAFGAEYLQLGAPSCTETANKVNDRLVGCVIRSTVDMTHTHTALIVVVWMAGRACFDCLSMRNHTAWCEWCLMCVLACPGMSTSAVMQIWTRRRMSAPTTTRTVRSTRR